MTLRKPTEGRWRKSTRSGQNANCVEVMALDEHVAVRDSKDPDGPTLLASAGAWRAFVHSVSTVE